MEILSQQDLMMIAPSYGKAVIGFGIGFLLLGIISILLCNISEMATYITFGTAVIFAAIALFLIIFSPRVDSGRNRYEVKLDETIDINEFYDEYEVIERRDKIWVIEDREAKDDANS
jgi:hypothetical protein